MGIPGAFGEVLSLPTVVLSAYLLVIGSVLLEGLVSALYTYLYFMHYSEDASTMKFLVFAIWILDTLHVSFICHVLYYYLITNYGVPTSLEYLVWSLPASLVVNVRSILLQNYLSLDLNVLQALVIAAAQCFFAHKIYYLCRPQVRWLVTAPIILLTLILFGFGIEIAVLIFVNNAISALLNIRVDLSIKILLYQLTSHCSQSYATVPFVATRVLDEVLITLSLCILLYEKGSRSAFPRTKHLMNTLVIYAVNRCFLTLLFAIAECVTIVGNEYTWAMGFEFNIGKLYANSLLASLNTRQYLRSQVSGSGPDLAVKTVHFGNTPNLSGDKEILTDGKRHLHVREMAIIDVRGRSDI
ncbi:hypothetical protein F5141DRAFT_1204124 [Pisolithus sp. B1]|nr:hypothetical protein F5141DRAFT_1204124 [Pisolithus sp. B1]